MLRGNADTTGFSRVEVQFLPDFAPSKKNTTRLKVGGIQKGY
jgi:hypothetical protein